METTQRSLSEAYDHVKARRPTISPNLDFMGHLLNFERTLQQRRSADANGAAERPLASSPRTSRGSSAAVAAPASPAPVHPAATATAAMSPLRMPTFSSPPPVSMTS